jgi:hypothetical protein
MKSLAGPEAGAFFSALHTMSDLQAEGCLHIPSKGTCCAIPRAAYVTRM